MELDDRISDLKRKLVVEEQVRNGAQAMRSKLTDKQTISQLETSLVESQKRIDFLENELKRLELRKVEKESGIVVPPSPNPLVASGENESFNRKNYSFNNLEPLDTSSTTIGEPAKPLQPANQKKHSNLDLRKAETGITTSKVALKLREITYKLDVEKKVKEGTERMHKLFQMDPSAGDKKSRIEVQQKLDDTNEKILLLRRALQKYSSLYVGDDEEDVNDSETIVAETNTNTNAARKAGMRRPITGVLHVVITVARQLAHAPVRGFRGSNDTFFVLKIDSVQQARSRNSRQCKWNESFELRVDKASELDVTIYDKSGDKEIPIGLFWVKIAEVTDEIRRRGVPNAEVVVPPPSSTPLTPSSSSGFGGFMKLTERVNTSSTLNSPSAENISSKAGVASFGQWIEAWWDAEPVGEVHMKITFVRDGGRKKLSGLGRQGALRIRKGEVHELNGHKFISNQFYQVMRCAFCFEFLFNTMGYQCEDCRYLCHKRCYPKVVTKCISRVSTEVDPDEEKLNHRIPHRFVSFSNFAANWCCHCGFILPLGNKKGNRYCTECNITCHDYCAHLVPDFCGLSMETANRMLGEIKAAKRRLKERTVSTFQESISSPKPHTPTYDHPLPPIPTGISSPEEAPKVLMTEHIHESPVAKPAIIPEPVAEVKEQEIKPLTKTTLEDFKLISVLGRGNFGKVLLAEEKKSKNLYAIKVLKKEFVVQNEEIESTKSEKRIFLTANRERHPFLVGLHSCFQTDSRLYFVMEFVNGGDLMWHIQKQSFTEARAKYYACEILLALQYFHQNNIIYRDLKLDNILLTLEGHIKIADYGLCKENIGFRDRTNTFCGTPEFMAPEILLEQKYGRAVDWWAYGVLIYEMLLGQSPFHGEDEEEIFDAILEDEVLYPINMSRDSVSILQRLLTRDPDRRLGSGPEDAEEIKRHPFFKGVDWTAMLDKRIPPPYVPKIKSRLDTSNFDEEFTKERAALTPSDRVLAPDEQMGFLGFTYVASWAGDEKGW